jgi:hypothetical protein
MEACVGAHHLSRKLQMLGHDARLMPAKYVRPYSKGQKNDFRDAEAIAEAVQRPTMKFVATKAADQLDLQALHRVRERLVSQRTGIINQIRAFPRRGLCSHQSISVSAPARARSCRTLGITCRRRPEARVARSPTPAARRSNAPRSPTETKRAPERGALYAYVYIRKRDPGRDPRARGTGGSGARPVSISFGR